MCLGDRHYDLRQQVIDWVEQELQYHSHFCSTALFGMHVARYGGATLDLPNLTLTCHEARLTGSRSYQRWYKLRIISRYRSGSPFLSTLRSQPRARLTIAEFVGVRNKAEILHLQRAQLGFKVCDLAGRAPKATPDTNRHACASIKIVSCARALCAIRTRLT